MRDGASLKARVVNTDSQYNLPAQSLNLKNVSAREGLRHHYDDPIVQRVITFDMNILDCYARELKHLESFIENKGKHLFGAVLPLVRTFPGIGQIIALTILYEIDDISRFASVRQFASYSRLVKCKAESAGKAYGTSGNKIGNGYLKCAFSEAAVLYLRGNDKAKRYLEKLQKRINKAKALSALAHKIGRCIYFMIRDKQVFDEEKFLKG